MSARNDDEVTPRTLELYELAQERGEWLIGMLALGAMLLLEVML